MALFGQAVIYPLGLAAFGLAILVYVLLQEWKPKYTLLVLVSLIIIGAGLYLAFMKTTLQPTVSSGEKSPVMTSQEPKGGPTPKAEPSGSVHQETHGPGSPAVQGGTGNVTIQYGPEKEKK